MGTWTTPNNASYMSIGGITFNIGDAMNAGYNPFQENIPYGVLTALGRMNRARGPFGSGNPLAIGTAGEDTYIDNSFAQQTDANVATCEAQGKDFDPVNQICVPKDAVDTVLSGAAEKAEDILTTVVGGISSVTGIDGLIGKAGEGIANATGDIIGTLLPGFDADIVIDPTGGVSATVTPPNTNKNPNTTQSGVTVGSTSNTQGGTTTVSVDAGDIGNLVLGGGSLKDAVDIVTGEGTEGAYTQSDLILQAACVAQGKEYDYTSGRCVEKSGKSKLPPPGSGGTGKVDLCPEGSKLVGKPVPVDKNCNPTDTGGNTTVTVGSQTDAELCAQTGYAIANPDKCRKFWEQCSDGKWAIKGKCPAPTTTTTTTTTGTGKAAICPDGTDKAKQEIPAGQTVAWCTTTDTGTGKAAICPDGTDKAKQEIPAGQTVAWCTDKAAICPDGTDKAKQEIPAGQTVAWCTTTDTGTGKAAICPDGTDKAKQEIPAGQTVAWCTDKAATCPDGTDKAKQEIPAGQTVAWCTDKAATCPDGTDKAKQEIPAGETVAWCTDKAATCPDGTDKAKQEIPAGETVAWCTDKAAICPDNTDKAKQEIPVGETVAWCKDKTTTTTTTTDKAATCPDGTDKVGKTIPPNETIAWCKDKTTTTTTTTDKAATCPDGTDKVGQTIPDGQTVAWCTEASGVDPKCDEVRAECAKLGKAMKDDCSGCVDTVVAGEGTPSGGDSSLPSFIPRSALNVIKQDKPDLVNIDYLYDIGGESIFAPTLQGMEEGSDLIGPQLDGNPYATRAKKGGIIGNANTVDQIISLLGEK